MRGSRCNVRSAMFKVQGAMFKDRCSTFKLGLPWEFGPETHYPLGVDYGEGEVGIEI